MLHNRASGRTTRAIDDVIQQFFNRKMCLMYDHHGSKSADKNFADRVKARLYIEHGLMPGDDYYCNSQNTTIELYDTIISIPDLKVVMDKVIHAKPARLKLSKKFISFLLLNAVPDNKKVNTNGESIREVYGEHRHKRYFT